MSDTFGDIEPEDSWHPDDPVPILVFNLLRRIDLLDRRREGTAAGFVIRALEALVEDYQDRRDDDNFSERDRVRIDQLVEDYEHVRARHDGF